MTKFYDDVYSFEHVRGYQFVKLYISMFEKWLESPQSGPGPTRLRARARNRDRLENRSHVVPKTEFQDGGGRTRKFTHKITILA